MPPVQVNSEATTNTGPGTIKAYLDFQLARESVTLVFAAVRDLLQSDPGEASAHRRLATGASFRNRFEP
jgi:hypothetical protein